MLYEEAKWVGSKMKTVFTEGQQVLNLGSSTLYSRTVVQPHMAKFIFEPLKNMGVKIVHCDIVEDEGVDLVGDFTDPTFIEKLKSKSFDGVLCCNLLEHLQDRKPLIDSLNEITPSEGILLLTVPKQYPYHLDPIDTLYRPTPNELALLFPQFDVINSEVVRARRQVQKNGVLYYHKSYYEQLKGDPKLFIRLIFRSFFPFYKYNSWKVTFNDLKNMFRPFSVSCLILKRKL